MSPAPSELIAVAALVAVAAVGLVTLRPRRPWPWRPGPEAPPEPAEPAEREKPREREGIVLPDDVLTTQAELLLQAAAVVQDAALRQRLQDAIAELGLEVFQPRQDAPFHAGEHEEGAVVATADPARDGAVAWVICPGLSRRGEVALRARVSRYRYRGAPLVGPE